MNERKRIISDEAAQSFIEKLRKEASSKVTAANPEAGKKVLEKFLASKGIGNIEVRWRKQSNNNGVTFYLTFSIEGSILENIKFSK